MTDTQSNKLTHSNLHNNLKSLVESLLFVAEGPVTIIALARALETDAAKIENAIAELREDYAERGIRLQRSKDRLQLVSAPEAAQAIEKFLGLEGSGHLSTPALETLAIIAYRQPITRPALEAVRGVNCDGVIHSLTTRGLIQEVGRLETAGRAILYGTTFDFLQNFGLRSVDDLPPLEEEIENVLDAAVVEQVSEGAGETRIVGDTATR
jgi:segregation and condensation protein B